MTLHRREFLKLAGLVAASASAACSPIYAQLSGLPRATGLPASALGPGYHALQRLTFGPTLEDVARVQEAGVEAWIEEQLNPEGIDDPVHWRLRPLDALRQDADGLIAWEREDAISQLRQGTLLRQVYSRRQLQEMMVAFWTDHFNITVAKGDCWFLKVVDDREVIRRHAMGSFRDLLWASAHSPAMLVYLDNQANDRNAPNENYARELMELHTLGVEGGYSQADVMELARCLTGWTVKEHFWRGQFVFEPDMHDEGEKTVLGYQIAPSGQREAEEVLEILAAHPSTARYVATKLARRFLHDDPQAHAAGIIDRAAEAFLRTQGDIPSVLRVILIDGLARGGAEAGPKLRRPLEFVTSALRTLGAETNGGNVLHSHLASMGQPLFEWPTPDGPPDEAPAWSSGLMPRWRYALTLAFGELDGTQVPWESLLGQLGSASPGDVIERFGLLLLGSPLPSAAADRAISALNSSGPVSTEEAAKVVAAGLLASPAYQWR